MCECKCECECECECEFECECECKCECVSVWASASMVEGVRTTTSQKFAAVPRRLVFKAHRLCVSLNSRLESNKEERSSLREGGGRTWAVCGCE